MVKEQNQFYYNWAIWIQPCLFASNESPMPTSKSLDAILANTLLNTTTLPTAVTANYWGSINWIAYDAEIAQQESAGGTLIKKKTSLVLFC